MKNFHIITLSVFICLNYQANSQNPSFLWAKQFGAASYDIGQSIAVDDMGNVFTLGYFDGTVDFDPGPGIFNLTSSNGIFFVSKLDANGNFIWVKQTGGSAFTVDGNGNVYITGGFNNTIDLDPGPGIYNLNPIGNADMFISKLDASGNFIWAKQIGGTDWVASSSICLDANGNIYTTGNFGGKIDFDPGLDTSSLTSSGQNDIFINKLDPSGNFLWAKQFSDANNNSSNSIAVDADGYVYTTGFFIFTMDFDPGPDIFNLTGTNNGDAFVSKLDALGNFIWAKQLGAAASGSSIKVDVSGNIYTTGRFSFTSDFDPGPDVFNLTTYYAVSSIFVSKLDTDGNFIWAKQMGGASTSSGGTINVDSIGNTFITGTFLGAPDFDPGPGNYNLTSNGLYDIFISKLDSDGNFLWAIQLGDGNNDSGGSILDPSGNIYTTGYFSGTADFNPSEEINNLSSAGIYDIFVLKFSQVDPCTAVSISTQPLNQSATVGGMATFNVIADGTAPFTYQWRKNDVNISGANSASYATPSLTLLDNGKTYSCYVTNCDGSSAVTSSNAILTICTTPTIQASNISLTSFCPNQMTANWTNGNGDRRVVKINTSNVFSALSNGTDPTPNATYAGSGEQVVYNGNSNTVTVSGLSPNTTYWLRVYEANCAGSSALYKTTTATQNPKSKNTPAPMLLTFTTTPTCIGSQNGTATVNVTGGNGEKTYTWSTNPPATLKTITGLAAGNYSVVVTDTKGCTASGMTTVATVPGNMTISLLPSSPDCPGGGNGKVTTTVTGGLAPYTYLWSNLSTSKNLSNVPMGSYSISVTDKNNCVATKSTTIVDPAGMMLTFSTSPTCVGTPNGTATANVTGGTGGKTYLWNTNATTKTITGLAANTSYTVTVKDAKGCTVMGMTTVLDNSPITATSNVSPSNSPPFSVTITAIGGTSPYKYRKRPINGNYPNQYQNSNVFTNLAEGVYFFETKDAIGCTFEFSQTVGKAGDCPYPIIFIHGWTGNEDSWAPLYNNSNFQKVYGELTDTFYSVNNAQESTNIWGINNIKYDSDDDVLVDFMNEHNNLAGGCLYAVSMDNYWNGDENNPLLDIHGSAPFDESDSNESAIEKNGYVIKKVIEKVLAANPSKKKVILVGHSMGGLDAREYLQRTDAGGMHIWWQNPSDPDGHNVAKLFTAGTPHRGSNTLGGFFKKKEDIAEDISLPDLKSEAVRDFRYSYDNCGIGTGDFPGLYLYGYIETALADCTDFHNYDVNCDGVINNDYIKAINQVGTPAWDGTKDNPSMALPSNVRYTYYVSNILPIIRTPTPVIYGSGGDGAVDDQREWLFSGGTGTTSDFFTGVGLSKSVPVPFDGMDYHLSDRFTSENSVDHTSETADVEYIVRGFDEGDFPEFAWEVESQIQYAGMAQIRPEKTPLNSNGPLVINGNTNDRMIDGDWFKVNLEQSGKKISIEIQPNQDMSGRIDLFPLSATLPPYSNANASSQFSKTFNIGTNIKTLTTPSTMTPGTYLFRITHKVSDAPVPENGWQKPYKFKVTFPNGFVPEPGNRSALGEIEIGEVYPNPIASAYNIDIFNPTTDTKSTFGLFNPVGQVVFEESKNLTMGDNTLTFPSDNLAPGIYFMVVQIGNVKKTLKVLRL